MNGFPKDDALAFADSLAGPLQAPAAAPWKILIVDDDPAIHAITKLALGNSLFHGRPIAWLDAHNGGQAVALMRENPDVALILMDVIMESETAGLDAAQRIREDLGNTVVRIAVRTGQAGLVHEETVVKKYGIDDYREKTDLTATRLFTLVHTSLAHYEQLRQLEYTRTGLQRVLDATRSVFQLQTVASFAEGVLHHLGDLLYRHGSVAPIGVTAVAVEQGTEHPARVTAVSGPQAPRLGQPLSEVEHADIRDRIGQALVRRSGAFDAHYFTAWFHTHHGDDIAVYLSSPAPITAETLGLAVLFCRNVSAAIENRHLEREKERAQSEMVVTLSEAIEARSRETGHHVRRVAEYSRLLGQLAGLDSRSTHLLFLAAPLHDTGKIAIPDAVLHKPGPHDEAEATIMRTHAELGREIFAQHDSPVLQAAAIVAGQHHERWDGQGYPNGMRGEDIHIFGRITAVADVFDALTHARCYKEAWSLKRALEYLVAESGSRFDPSLVALFMQNLDQFLDIHNRLLDPPGSMH